MTTNFTLSIGDKVKRLPAAYIEHSECQPGWQGMSLDTEYEIEHILSNGLCVLKGYLMLVDPRCLGRVRDNVVSTRNLHEKTAQEVFDFVVGKLRKQGSRCTSASGSCQYREFPEKPAEGRRCAAGWLIADGDYLPKMEGDGWAYPACILIGNGAIQGNHGEEWSTPHYELICDIQAVHDNLHERLWETGDGRSRKLENRGFKGVADKYHLTYTPPSDEN